MRVITVAALIVTSLCVSLAAQTVAPSADALLQAGLNSYRSGSYQQAASELSAAAQAFLSPEQMEKYVSSGKFENLGGFETALVYLAMAQSKLGNEDAARESVLRLITAERIAPTYAALALDADAAEFEALARRIVPDSALPANIKLAGGSTAPAAPRPGTPAPPPVQVAETRPSQPPLQTVIVPAPEAPVAEQPPAPVPAPVAAATSAPPPAPLMQPQPQPVQNAEAERLERERYIEQRLAEERARIERAAEERIAAERVAIQRQADARVAAVQREADQRVAAERAAAQRVSAPAPAPAVNTVIDTTDTATRRDYLGRLREAEGLVADTQFRRAAAVYSGLARLPVVPRDILAEAATGLYRTGAFREAAAAFERLGTFARGEEDLRYYHAVVLYETGQYEAAKTELSCALPFIQITDEVARYRTKIQQTPTRQVTSQRDSPAT